MSLRCVGWLWLVQRQVTGCRVGQGDRRAGGVTAPGPVRLGKRRPGVREFGSPGVREFGSVANGYRVWVGRCDGAASEDSPVVHRLRAVKAPEGWRSPRPGGLTGGPGGAKCLWSEVVL